MDRLSSDILIEFCLFCEFKDIINLLQVNKCFNQILTEKNFFWIKYARTKLPNTFSSGPYFDFPSFASIANKMWIPSEVNQFKLPQLKQYWNAVSNPKSIFGSPVEASSEDYSQGIDCTLDYDDGKFWSSARNDSEDTDEYLIYKLKSKCFVFSVHFKVYRSVYQEGVVYSPRTVKVKIGNSLDNYHYESEEFEVGITEKYNTILILPNFIEGEYVRIEFYGKQMKEPQTEKYYTVLSFVDIIGFPKEKLELNNEAADNEKLDIEDVIKNGNTDILSDPRFKRTPFLYERIIKSNKLPSIIDKLNQGSKNEIENYLFMINKIGTENFDVTEVDSSEICAQYLYDNGKIEVARQMYLQSRDYWGVCKCLIILEDYGILKDFIRYNSSRIPRFNDILRFAKELGSDYEAKIREKLG